MSFFKMAWRNVWRNRRRTIVTVAAASLALLVLIQYAGLMDGYLRTMESNILDLDLGDAQITAQGYRDDPSLYRLVDNHKEVLQALDEAGYPAAPRLLGGGLGAAGDTSAGVALYGVDVTRDAEVSKIGEHVAQGRWLDPADPKGVVIGRRLARTLNVALGAEVVVLTQAADGSTANDVFVVRGILKGIADGVDRAGIFMPEPTFRELMVVPRGVHLIIVRRPAEVPLPVAALKVKELAGEHDAKTWRELTPTLASMLDSARGIQVAMFLIVYLAVGILILNAMLMAVFERIREFGVLKALGAGPGAVLRIIFLETLIQAGLAIVIGSVLSVPGMIYLSRVGIDVGVLGGMSIHGIAWDPIWRAAISIQAYARPIVTLLVVVVLAVLYPAFKAALIRPVQAIHHS